MRSRTFACPASDAGSLPHDHGVEVFARVRHLYPTISVVLCSGYSLTQAVEGITPPPDWFVRKPYSVRDLLEAIGEATVAARAALPIATGTSGL